MFIYLLLFVFDSVDMCLAFYIVAYYTVVADHFCCISERCILFTRKNSDNVTITSVFSIKHHFEML